MSSTSYRTNITIVLVRNLLWPGCQSRLYMNEKANAGATAKIMVDASTQTPESGRALSSTHGGKRAASELSRSDTEEKKESPVAVARRQQPTDSMCLLGQSRTQR